jgi:hypothetical protein
LLGFLLFLLFLLSV